MPSSYTAFVIQSLKQQLNSIRVIGHQVQVQAGQGFHLVRAKARSGQELVINSHMSNLWQGKFQKRKVVLGDSSWLLSKEITSPTCPQYAKAISKSISCGTVYFIIWDYHPCIQYVLITSVYILHSQLLPYLPIPYPKQLHSFKLTR